MTVEIKCRKCGLLGMFTGNKDYKMVTKIVMNHKTVVGNERHSVKVTRS